MPETSSAVISAEHLPAARREHEEPRTWLRDARQTLQAAPVDYFEVDSFRYWSDFLLSLVIAYTAGSLFLLSPLGSWQQWVAYPIAIFWLYRLGSLVHEVCHLSHQEMQPYKVAWNLLVGVVTLAPSPFFTRHHRDHHSQRLYGTREDPEYIVNCFEPGSLASLALYWAYVAVFPLVVFLRFLLVPLTYLHPALREWTLVHASSLTMNWRYERRLTTQDRWSIAAVEWLCWIRASLILAGPMLGLSDWSRLPMLYSLAIGVLVLNQLRLLADHHFESRGDHLELPDHIRDSCNFTSNDPLTWLLFPFAIQYHALHHLFPTLPYHNLAAAHGHLTTHLPADSPYHTLDQGDWWTVARHTLFPGRATPLSAPVEAY